MAFYKLFKIVHHRTDYEKLYRIIHEKMHPEYYAAIRQQGKEAVMRLVTMTSIIDKLGGYKW